MARHKRQFRSGASFQQPVGDLISLDDRRSGRAQRAARGAPAGARPLRPSAPVTFTFDLGSPWTYLAAERVERLFEGLVWRPVAAPDAPAIDRAAVETRARELRMPLVWPDVADTPRGAVRVAALAAEHGCAGPFVVATGRLIFCGGYDVGDPEIIIEAAAAAGLGLEETLHAARDRTWDERLARAAAQASACQDGALPALSVGGRHFCGEHRIPEAVAAHADLRSGRRSQLVPTRGSR